MKQDVTALAAQYGTDANLRVRMETHRRYTVGEELEPAVDAALALAVGEALLDVGTGPGDFPGRLRAAGHGGRLVGADLSPGMIERGTSAYPSVEFVVADAQALPFADGTFDVVTARHMLYHVPHIPQALREMQRILKPGGRFLAVTNALDNLSAYRRLRAQALQEITTPDSQAASSLDACFDEVVGESLVGDAFGEATVTFVEAALAFPGIEPVLAYFDTERTMRGFEEAAWQRAHQALSHLLEREFAETKPWRVSKRVALITATR